MADLLLFPALPDEQRPELADLEARRSALDIRQSFIVEAPAGSGKTGLLIQRYLKLLGDPQVQAPEQVLAITFTRKATAEMRDRVLAHLEAAAKDQPVGDSEFDRDTRELAMRVLARATQSGWSLLTEPARLRIRTIDALCAEIAGMLPVLSGSGGRLSPTDQAGALYREAARRTLLQLGGQNAELHKALRDVLLHRDGNLGNCEELIADMLNLRDQWGDLIWGMLPEELQNPQRATLDDSYLDTHVLPRLEAAMDEAICSALEEVRQAFAPDLLDEAASIAAELGDTVLPDAELAACAGMQRAPQACTADLDRWKGLAHMLIAPSADGWRKSLTARTLGAEPAPKTKTRLKHLLSRLEERDELRALMCEMRNLPAAHYPKDQWRVAKALFRVLRWAMAELQLVFAEREQCDFTELGLLARHVLSQSTGAEDLAEAAGSRLQHMLVDEMQDTSAGQYELLDALTRSWDGHSQTVFLVGDPRQSIYLFRQARVERFLRAIRERRLGDLPLKHLKLSANFRSQAALVDAFNTQFTAIFPRHSDALPYREAEAVLPPSATAASAIWHATVLGNAGRTTTPTAAEVRQQRRKQDAEDVVKIAREWMRKPLPPQRRLVRGSSGQWVPEPWRIAVLVRVKNHLMEIAAALDAAGIATRAVNIEALNERQEILDLTALTRVLLHPADRVAGLAVLRAPWCGLPLADLHTLTGQDDRKLKDSSIPRLLQERGVMLPAESGARATRVQAVLEEAAAQRGRLRIAVLVEKAWRTLGGDALLDGPSLANAERFFELLAQMESEAPAGGLNLRVLEGRLRELYAETKVYAPEVGCVELLTIHKAKGLEWDVVVVPGLERIANSGKQRMLAWTMLDASSDEHADAAGVMLAPIAARGDQQGELSTWLGCLNRKREAAELKRLFYVACTRAREELHLFASPMENADGELKPKAGTLLRAAWPAARQYFQQTALPVLRRAVEAEDVPATTMTLAAAAETPRVVAGLRRIPLRFDPRDRFRDARRERLPYGSVAEGETEADARAELFSRPEGSFAARAFGNVIHELLDVITRELAQGKSEEQIQQEVSGWDGRIHAMLRSEGLSRPVVERLGAQALSALQQVLKDADGAWIMGRHAGAASELSLTAAMGTGISTIRADRTFFAGSQPQSRSEEYLWIVDYKTSSHGRGGLEEFLQRQRESYAAQLAVYARTLAPALGATAGKVRLGLYFPAIPRLVWWEPEAAR